MNVCRVCMLSSLPVCLPVFCALLILFSFHYSLSGFSNVNIYIYVNVHTQGKCYAHLPASSRTLMVASTMRTYFPPDINLWLPPYSYTSIFIIQCIHVPLIIYLPLQILILQLQHGKMFTRVYTSYKYTHPIFT